MRADISLGDISLDAVRSPPPERQHPTPRSLALAAVFLLLLGTLAAHARRPARPHPPYVGYEVAPPLSEAVVRSSRGYFLMNLGAHEFTYVVGLANTTTWPVLVTRLRVDLPPGLREVDPLAVLDIPPPGRSPAQLSFPLALVQNVSVQVIVRLAVECERMAAIRATPAKLLVAASIGEGAGERAGEVDLICDLVMFGQAWSVSLAADVCSEPAVPSTASTPRR